MIQTEEIALGRDRLVVEQGRVARQASGALTVRMGDTMILAASVFERTPTADRGFVPLTVDYREKYYAAGKIPGGFFKREGRPHEKEILSARLVDRSVRPLFLKEFLHEIQVLVTVLSQDHSYDADVLGIVGASAAVAISEIPFNGPVGAVRVARVGDEYVINPTFKERDEATLELVVTGTKDSVLMVEGGAKEASEEQILEAIRTALGPIGELVELQERLVAKVGKTKREMSPPPDLSPIESEVRDRYLERIRQALSLPDKEARESSLEEVRLAAVEELAERFPEQELLIRRVVDDVERDDMRRMVITEGRRADGRGLDEVRPITCELGVLPRAHGSALFTRGQTQSLCATTLGTSTDEQKVDDLEGEGWKSYMLHYNFPPFSVGEVRPIRGPGRREIGHGALAERSIAPVIPPGTDFPYTVRVVSEILESNGSSSMASVCAASLSLMDAGVPTKAQVSGVAMGLIKEGDQTAILTDILGVEDHLGDMDFKVAGTREGVTGFQMDVKIRELTFDIFSEALRKSRDARHHILEIMNRTLAEPRPELSVYAPRIIAITIDREKIRDIIGPGGKTIRRITEETGATVDVEDDGTVHISSVDPESGKRALNMIKVLVEDPEVGKVYHGVVKRVTDFGAFVEILPGKDGLLHISELEPRRVAKVEDVVREGDEVDVKVIAVDREGKVKLSRKALLV